MLVSLAYMQTSEIIADYTKLFQQEISKAKDDLRSKGVTVDWNHARTSAPILLILPRLSIDSLTTPLNETTLSLL
jgi:biotin operon repressor